MLPTGARLIWAEDATGAIGKVPKDGLVEIDAASYLHAVQQNEYLRTRKAKRGDL